MVLPTGRKNSPIVRKEGPSAKEILQQRSQLLALAPASERPLTPTFPCLPGVCHYQKPIPSIFFDMSFLAEDQDKFTRTATEIDELPDRIHAHRRKYKAMTNILEVWLIDNVELYPYPAHYASHYITSNWAEDKSEWEIEPPIENFLNVARHLAYRIRFTSSVFTVIKDLIATRDLVSAWYTNVQDAEPPLPIDCAVRRKTDTHVHFTDMLRKLLDILEGAQAESGEGRLVDTYEFRRFDGGTMTRRIRIKQQSRNEEFVKSLARTTCFPPNIANDVGNLVRTRTFVSESYKNVQNKEPKLPADCEVAKKTDSTNPRSHTQQRRLPELLTPSNTYMIAMPTMIGDNLADLETVLRALGLRPSRAASRKNVVHEIGPDLTAPYPFENGINFLSISVGFSYKFDNGRGLLEAVALGCAELDMDDERLKCLPPGVAGIQWVNEMCSYPYAIEGREAFAEYTAQYVSHSVRRTSMRQLERWLRTGVEPTTGIARHTIIICEDEAEMSRFFEQEGIQELHGNIMIASPLVLFNSALSESEPAATTQAEVCQRLGLQDVQYSNIRDRAERALQTILAIALKAANNSAPVLGGATEILSRSATTQAQIAQRPLLEPSKKSLVRLYGIARNLRASAANLAISVVKLLGASPPSAHTPVFTDTEILPSEISTTQQGLGATIDETPRPIPIEHLREQASPAQVLRWTYIRRPPASVAHPDPRLEGYDDDNFTAEDEKDVSIDSTTHEISNLPDRVDIRVKRYKDMAAALVLWLTTVAKHYDYSNLPACLTPDSTRLERISRFVELANFITTQIEIPLTVLQHVYEIIALRSFVMRWHQDLVAKKGFRDDGVIATKTKGHQAFVRTMQRVYDIGWSTPSSSSDSTDSEDQ
ncbi:hypothetical protein LTR17_016556 [Elasticomyces elasticus]|nr:hypothetical protein LTR17_016556 [Elasticomyces elasticus]